MANEDKKNDDKKAVEKFQDNRVAAAEKSASVEAAKSVADAVAKVAAAAVAEVQKASTVKSDEDFVATGTPGGQFALESKSGRIFSSSGTVLLNGSALLSKHWNVERVVGALPADAKEGVVTVVIDADTKYYGYLKF